MKELKSKKTGRINVVTEEEYATIVNSSIDLHKFIITDLKSMKTIVPKESLVEIKKIIKKTKE